MLTKTTVLHTTLELHDRPAFTKKGPVDRLNNFFSLVSCEQVIGLFRMLVVSITKMQYLHLYMKEECILKYLQLEL